MESEQYCEIIRCENGEQATWLVERLEKDDPGKGGFSREENDVWVFSWGEQGGQFDHVAKAVVDFQKHFEIKIPWVGSYGIAAQSQSMISYSGAVVAYFGKTYWVDATGLAKAKAKELTKQNRKKRS